MPKSHDLKIIETPRQPPKVRQSALAPLSPKAPVGMTAIERRIWKELFESAGSMWSAADRGAVRRLCEMRAEQMQHRKAMREEKWFEQSRQGTAKHPRLSVLNQLEQRLAALEVQLGLTPAARYRAGLAKHSSREGLNPEYARLIGMID